MKRFILFAFVLTPFFVKAQKNKSYSEVVQIDSISAEKLYTTARNWYFETFKSSKDVINIEDKETGQISGNGIINIHPHFRYMGQHTSEASVKFRMSVFVKDNKYKYEIIDLYAYDKAVEYGYITDEDHCPISVPMISKKKMDEFWRSVKFETDKEINGLITSLKDYMLTKTKSQNNW